MSKQFYVDGLGFQVDWEHRFEPGFPVFAQVSRDGLAFFLTEHTGDCPVGGLIHLYVAVEPTAGLKPRRSRSALTKKLPSVTTTSPG